MMKYRSSISDLGDSNSALNRLTNTRIKSLKNRRGAVKYQKYVFVLVSDFQLKSLSIHLPIALYCIVGHITLMGINLWRNSSDNPHFVYFVRNFYGASGSKDINALVSKVMLFTVDSSISNI